MPGSREEDFLRNTSIPKLSPLGVVGHEIFNLLSPYPTDTTYQIWLRL